MTIEFEDWQRTEPFDQLDWVDDYMREVRNKYLLWDKEYGGAHEIVFTEGQYTMECDDPCDRVRDFQEVCFWNGEQEEAVIDDHVYYNRDEAESAAKRIRRNLLGWRRHLKQNKDAVVVLAFRHGDNEMGNACTIEPSVMVNRLGWAVFVRRDLLEDTNMIIHKYPTEDE